MLWFDCEFILRVSQREGLPERVDIVSLAVAVEQWSLQRPPIMMIDVLSSLLPTSSPSRHPNTERVERREGGRESLRRRAPNERRRVATNADARRSSPLLRRRSFAASSAWSLVSASTAKRASFFKLYSIFCALLTGWLCISILPEHVTVAMFSRVIPYCIIPSWIDLPYANVLDAT